MFYVHFYPQMPLNRAFRAKKRERVYRSLMPGADEEIRTLVLLFTKQIQGHVGDAVFRSRKQNRVAFTCQCIVHHASANVATNVA